MNNNSTLYTFILDHFPQLEDEPEQTEKFFVPAFMPEQPLPQPVMQH